MNERIKWYRDPVWQTMGTFVAVVALAATVWFFWLGREAKGLTVTILVETPLVSVASEADGLGDLTVLYKGEPAGNVTFVQVKVENTGNRAIRAEDFSTSLQFTFGDGVRILDAAVVETVPDNLGMTVDVVGDVGVGVAPLLLNKGDRAVLRFLVDRELGLPTTVAVGSGLRVDARIVDVPSVSVLRVLDNPTYSLYSLFSFYRPYVLAFLMTILLITVLGSLIQLKDKSLQVFRPSGTSPDPSKSE